MPWWQWLLDSLGLVLLVVLLFGVLLVLRRRVLARNGGTFELSVRDAGRLARAGGRPGGKGGVLGIRGYRDDSLEWYRIFSPVPRPRHTWRRNDLTLVRQRGPEGSEEYSLYAGHLVVLCDTPAGEVELALSPSSLTGLQSWLEAGPPGSRPSR